MGNTYRLGKGELFIGGLIGDISDRSFHNEGIVSHERVDPLLEIGTPCKSYSFTIDNAISTAFIGGRILCKKVPKTPEYVEMLENMARVEPLPLSHQEITVVEIKKSIARALSRAIQNAVYATMIGERP